jgi:hypothetical protein
MNKMLYILLGVTIAALSFVPIPATRITMVWEAEGFAAIIPPMEVVQNAKGASGSTFVRLPLGAGQGWRGEGIGEVSYRVELPSRGDYLLWARTLWQDGCTNAFYMRVADGPQTILGNDAIFGAWHWVRSSPLRLSEGMNYITIANHSDGTALDKIVLTNDPLYVPEGVGEGITRFFDGFGGCDGDNTGSWELVAGMWKVVPGTGAGSVGVNDCLAQWDPNGGKAIAGFSNWRNYSISTKVLLTTPGTAGLEMYNKSESSSLRFTIRVSDDETVLSLVEQRGTKPHVLGISKSIPVRFDYWYELAVQNVGDAYVCLVDGAEMIRATSSVDRTGRIGISASTGGVFFDNVEVNFESPSP